MKRLFFKLCRQWPSVASFLILGLFCLAYISVAATSTLTVTIVGSGSVNSAPAGIACTNGSSSGCSASFTNLSGVTLTSTPAWNSKAGVFSGACSGTPSCFFNISTNTGVTATFNPNYQAILLGHSISPNFTTLTDAYADANDQSTIAANANYTFHEDLTLNDINGKFIRLYLGKDVGFYYAAPIGFTTLQGSLTVQAGSVEIDSLIIE